MGVLKDVGGEDVGELSWWEGALDDLRSVTRSYGV